MMLALPKMETDHKNAEIEKRFGFFQFIFHSLRELETYSLLRIIRLANFFL